MRADHCTFVFVHGFWHDMGTWDHVLPGLEAKGHTAHAIDLPGAGANARMPASYSWRPLDRAAFAVEPSPNAGVTQEERTRAVIAVIKSADRPVILIGHSLGGATISDVAETVPELLEAVVYLTAFLLPPGMPPIAMIEHETMVDAMVPSLFLADPVQVGALRLDPFSEDPTYRAMLKAAFYADVADADLVGVAARLHCDEPVATVLRPSAVTAGRFGTVKRHYIRCTEDRAIPIVGQDHMIAAMDRAMGNETIRHTLASSHSPFYSQPAELVQLLADIGTDSINAACESAKKPLQI
ncbi:alpha/beta hydrolase [Burkholderia sp. Ac-20345]|uniref:alpha/beta fold hydrolase n=1 Tax=Burkholderia sp. Ac-20345 TaxID=2703891 RepID=UPI00197BAAF6|nr:alpha/beta fold hydrolase [Burkholderia sp. Ac-20345]MBN3780379.1 alpha/beta hydrolase [Burkholderia sp. Ac-20345]